MSNNGTTRVVVAMMEHETNTFSPVPTPIERFGRGGFGVPEGPAAYQAFKGTGTGIGGLLDAADSAGLATMNGLAMLVHQAVEQLEIWTGSRPDAAPLMAAAQSVLDQRR